MELLMKWLIVGVGVMILGAGGLIVKGVANHNSLSDRELQKQIESE